MPPLLICGRTNRGVLSVARIMKVNFAQPWRRHQARHFGGRKEGGTHPFTFTRVFTWYYISRYSHWRHTFHL